MNLYFEMTFLSASPSLLHKFPNDIFHAGAIMEFLEKAVQSPNDVKMLMSDDMGSKIPSNVSPWHANEKIHR